MEGNYRFRVTKDWSRKGLTSRPLDTKAMTRPVGVIVASSLMILFGILEVVTGFSHNFVGISASTSLAFTVVGATIGAFYSVAGVLTLTMNRRAVLCAMVLLAADVVGRLSLVATGLFPLDSTENTIGIVGGTSIAVVFAIYLGLRFGIFARSSRQPGSSTAGETLARMIRELSRRFGKGSKHGSCPQVPCSSA